MPVPPPGFNNIVPSEEPLHFGFTSVDDNVIGTNAFILASLVVVQLFPSLIVKV